MEKEKMIKKFKRFTERMSKKIKDSKVKKTESEKKE